MDIASYTSNIQPYGVSGGTKIASNKEDVQHIASSVKNDVAPSKKQDGDSDKSVEQAGEALKARQEINQKELEAMVEQMQDFVDSINTGLSFKIDDDGRNIITIYEAKTGDIIRQIPSDDMLEILRRLSSDSGGLIVESV